MLIHIVFQIMDFKRTLHKVKYLTENTNYFITMNFKKSPYYNQYFFLTNFIFIQQNYVNFYQL